MSRRLWIGLAFLFALAVASGFLPDLMLAREERAARAEGLLRPPESTPFVPVTEDAHLRYTEIVSHYPTELARLGLYPKRPVLDPGVRRVIAEFAEASKRRVYREIGRHEVGGPTFSSQDVKPILSLVAQTLAANARGEGDLHAAARMADHLRRGDDPTNVPSPAWSEVAGAVLDGADRLRLPPQRFMTEIGDPDPEGALRRHVAALLALQSDRLSFMDKRRRVRFIAFWRGFLKDLPRDPDTLVRVIADRQEEIVRVDSGLQADYSVAGEWRDWAVGVARVMRRVGR